MSIGLKTNKDILRTPNQQIVDNFENIQENSRLIQLHYETDRVIANLGIRFIGRVDSYDEIKDIIPSQFGDAYNVGTQPPYDMYVWTRENANTPVEEGEWLNVGPLAIEGPEGPTPLIGLSQDGKYIISTDPKTGEITNVVAVESLKGKPGTRIKVVSSTLSYPSPIPTDIALISGTGELFTYGEDYQWHLNGNIKGAQGNIGRTGPAPKLNNNGVYITSTDPQTGLTENVVPLSLLKGEKGNTGDVGGFINIAGILPNSGLLKPPSELKNLTYAYLIGTQEPYILYIQVGENSETAEWKDVGTFNVATLVMENGQYQNIWDADTKLDKDTSITVYREAYIKEVGGTQNTLAIDSSAATANTLALRDGSGCIKTSAPITELDAINKNYADANYVIKDTERQPGIAGQVTVYGTFYDGTGTPSQATINVKSTPTSGVIARWNDDGCLNTSNPKTGNNCVNKTYVESWSFTRIESSDLTPSAGTASVNSNFGIYVNRATKVFSLTGRITLTKTDGYWPSNPTVRFDYNQISSALGGIVPIRTINVPITCYKILKDQTDPFVLPEGGQLVFTPTSMYVTLYETNKNYREPGSIYFHLNATVPYNG